MLQHPRFSRNPQGYPDASQNVRNDPARGRAGDRAGRPGLLRPAGLDMLTTVGGRTAMAAAAACLDALPKHLETVRRALMDRLDAEPDPYGRLFPHVARTSAISADPLWTSLALQAVWTDENATVTLDCDLAGAEASAPVLSAAFALNGPFTALRSAA